VPHDERLYISQILLVLASSPLAWTGSSARLRVLGYSLGGGIAVHFANAVPHLVESLVLLAPAGLIRAENFGAVSNFVFKSGLVPERVVAVLTRRRLQQPIASSKKKALEAAKATAESRVEAVANVAVAEAADPPSGQAPIPIEGRVLMYVRWMVINHPGFVPAFMSSIQHAPLTEQHASWEKLAQRKRGSTVVLLAERDEIIDMNEYTRTALPLIGGKDHVVWKVLPGGHDFVMTHSKLILEELDELWGAAA
jgi:pimeloyl-ACP methyl ester carboxylesterase